MKPPQLQEFNVSVTLEAASVDPTSVGEDRLRLAVRRIVQDAGVQTGQIDVAIVDDAAIHEMNRRYLNHDYPTDVLSFVLENRPGYLDGQIVASIDTARREAAEYGWRSADELLLYVVHGTLHLTGCDDSTITAATEMRAREREALAQFGLTPPWGEKVNS